MSDGEDKPMSSSGGKPNLDVSLDDRIGSGGGERRGSNGRDRSHNLGISP
jgi:hypothetical protein